MTQLNTTKPVRLGPPVVGVVSTSDQTITNCDPFALNAQFGELIDGCDQYPRYLFVKIRSALREETDYGPGYGYSNYLIDDREQIVVLEITTPSDLSIATGSGIYKGEVELIYPITGYGYGTTAIVTLYWNTDSWRLTGLAYGNEIVLSNGSQYNPLMSYGELTYFDSAIWNTYHFEVTVLNTVPTNAEGSGVEFFDCGNHIYGAADPIPYSLLYTDSNLVDAEWEVVSPIGIKYVKATTFDADTGRATYSFVPDQNGTYTFRVRGVSEYSFSTRFGNKVRITVEVPPPDIEFVLDNETIINLPYYGNSIAIKESTHTFQYLLTPNCYPTKAIQYSLDNEEWRGSDQATGLIQINRLVAGVHSLKIRALDGAGQYSAEANISFIVNLSTFVTIDTYPTDSLCLPNRITTVGGTREASAEITSIRGVDVTTLRFPTATTWEADVYLAGNDKHIVEIEVENLFGHTAIASQELLLTSQAPNFTVNSLKDTTYVSKVVFYGTKEINAKIEVSHNYGPWTTIVNSDPADSKWQYVLELVSGLNEIRLRAVDPICGFESESEFLSTVFVDSSYLNGVFHINDGDLTTDSTKVILSIVALNATRIQVSNFDDFREGYETDVVSQLSWTLTDDPGVKVVYMRFLNNQGSSSITFTDDILLIASTPLLEENVEEHEIHNLNATDSISGNPIGTVIVIKDNRNGTYSVLIFQDPVAALEGVTPVAIANTNVTGRQTLTLVDTGTGIVNVIGTVTVTIVKGAQDLYLDHKADIWDIKTGESIIPLDYQISEDARYFYAMLSLPYYESKFQGAVQEVQSIDTTYNTSKIAVDKVFALITSERTDTPFGYGYSNTFAQARENIPTPLKEKFATYPLAGMRFWYPTLSDYAMITEIDETDNSFILTIDKTLDQFDSSLACRIEFTRQDKHYIDYRIDKYNGVVEFINESTYATGNVQFEYEYAKQNLGRPDINWYQLCDLKYNDYVSITIPQTKNRITFNQLESICVRFYNGNEGTAPKIVRFIINDSIVYEDMTSDVIQGSEGYGYNYNYSGYGYRLTPGLGDQVLRFCAENTIRSDLIVDKIQIEFQATTPCMFIGEVIVNGETVPLDSNLQIVVNGVVEYSSTSPVSNQFDKYELRYEKGEVDVWLNNVFIRNFKVPEFDSSAVRRFFGASARTSGDEVRAVFQQIDDDKLFDENPIIINKQGRFVGIEPNMRQE